MLRATREKCQVIYKSKPIRITADLSEETLKAKQAWNDVFQALKENCQPRLLYLAKLSFIIFGGEIKTFHD
jgi:hypothetical protein